MDQPGLDEREHCRALAALGRINAASATCRQLWRQIAAFSVRRRRHALRLLDVASGGGEVALGLWKLARRHGVVLEVVGLDVSPTACRFAASRCHGTGQAIRFHAVDAVADDLPVDFDVAVSSLFLHQLSQADAVTVLCKMAAAAPLTLVSDLRRGVSGYLLAQAACRAVTRSSVVHFDGPQSVKNAFTIPEMHALVSAAGLRGARITRAWPCRMLLRYERA